MVEAFFVSIFSCALRKKTVTHTLPAGVYFVSVTDSEGRKCVRKVVRK